MFNEPVVVIESYAAGGKATSSLTCDDYPDTDSITFYNMGILNETGDQVTQNWQKDTVPLGPSGCATVNGSNIFVDSNMAGAGQVKLGVQKNISG